jgi:hypothetical protein
MRSAPLAEAARRDGATLRTASVLGLGHHLPEQVVYNLPIAERLGIDDSWIEKRTGIRSRRHAMPPSGSSDLATAAGSRGRGRGDRRDRARRRASSPHLGRRDHAQRGALRRHAIGCRQGQRDGHRRGLHRVRDALSVGASMIEAGRARPCS